MRIENLVQIIPLHGNTCHKYITIVYSSLFNVFKFRPSPITFKQQPTSSFLGLGRAEAALTSNNNNNKEDTLRLPPKKPYDTHSLIVQQQQHQHQAHLGRSQTPFHQVKNYTQPPMWDVS